MNSDNNIEHFVSLLLKEKGLSDTLDEAVHKELVSTLSSQLEEVINRNLLSRLSDDSVEEFNTFLEESHSESEIQAFFTQKGVNVAAVVAESLQQFRNAYLGDK